MAFRVTNPILTSTNAAAGSLFIPIQVYFENVAYVTATSTHGPTRMGQWGIAENAFYINPSKTKATAILNHF
jgi:hypothetical protein